MNCKPLVAALILAGPARGQELEPRRWSHLPLDAQFGGIGHGRSEARIFLDPVLRIEDASLTMQTTALKYIRTFELLGRSARFDLVQTYQQGRWDGLVDGTPTTVTRDGFGDTSLRLAVNLVGAPPLRGDEFRRYRAGLECETIVGAGLVVVLPTGEYLKDRLINLGGNRYVIRPQLGVVHQRGNWSFELTTSLWCYTDNDSFWNGNRREQDPLLALQGHLVYSFRPGLWVSASLGYGHGGESSVNDIAKDDRVGNLAWALTLGFPVSPRLGLKLSYIGTRTQEDTGLDSDTVVLAASYFW